MHMSIFFNHFNEECGKRERLQEMFISHCLAEHLPMAVHGDASSATKRHPRPQYRQRVATAASRNLRVSSTRAAPFAQSAPRRRAVRAGQSRSQA